MHSSDIIMIHRCTSFYYKDVTVSYRCEENVNRDFLTRESNVDFEISSTLFWGKGILWVYRVFYTILYHTLYNHTTCGGMFKSDPSIWPALQTRLEAI